MSRAKAAELLERRRVRTRGKLKLSSDRPRLLLSLSNRQVTAQIVDLSGKTLAYSTSTGQKLPPTLSARAKKVGEDIAKQAVKAKIKRVVFDRSGRRYHGRVKVLAEAARAGGLEF